MLFGRDDWAEDHHDVELVDDTGQLLARRRLPEGLDGVTGRHGLIAEYMPAEWADLEPRRVFAINPMSVASYRERHSTSGAKLRDIVPAAASTPRPHSYR